MATIHTPSRCLQLFSRPVRLCRRSKHHHLAPLPRHYHRPTPLYLDFLAPAWHPQQPSVFASRQDKSPSVSADYHLQRRPFASSSRQSAKAITNPRADSSGNEMNIVITPRAAHRLQTLSESDDNPNLALRVRVESGGCHGFQYLMSLVNVRDIDAEEDTVFENEEPARNTGSYKAMVVMDEPSLELLSGSSIDYTMELIGSQFKVTGIPGATSSCGCGTSFDIAA